MAFSSLINGQCLAHSSNYNQGRFGYKVCKITPHHMSGVLTAKRCCELFQNPSRNASANYCIGNDGQIYGCVDENNRAWTSSNKVNDCQAITIEVSNSQNGGQWPVSDAAWNSLVNLCVDICKRYGFRLTYDGTPNGSLTRHNMFKNTDCPGPYLQSKFPELVNIVNSRLDGTSYTPNTNTKSNEEIANEVIAGKWGNGEERKQKLANAGYDYNTIQSIVNQKLSGKETSKPATKSNEEIAQEVINGSWGNGEDRKARLQSAGYDYSTIQKLVNQKLSVSTSSKKSNEEICKEVWQGKWGNGADRKNRLQQAGYDANLIQSMVNKGIGK